MSLTPRRRRTKCQSTHTETKDLAVTDQTQETLDRARRIETRLTKYLEAIGFETGARKPVWNGDGVEVPSPATSLTDCLAAIPEGWDDELEVPVTFRGQVLGYIALP